MFQVGDLIPARPICNIEQKRRGTPSKEDEECLPDNSADKGQVVYIHPRYRFYRLRFNFFKSHFTECRDFTHQERVELGLEEDGEEPETSPRMPHIRKRGDSNEDIYRAMMDPNIKTVVLTDDDISSMF